MKVKINIASTHRFHLLDLARELDKQGFDVRFYSYVPTKRCVSFGLKPQCCYSFLWLAAPFLLLNKLFPRCRTIISVRNVILDWFMCFFMRPCDIYICLGSIYKQSIKAAKWRFNAIVILEWGSKHIIEQLKMFGRLNDYSQRTLKRELEGYELADYIAIATSHVKESFLKHGIDSNKLFVNPYGVDLSQFSPTRSTDEYDIIMVGGWRYEKGCDLLVEVCSKYHYRLLHVGAITNMDFPQDANMHHVDSVDQSLLKEYYKQAKVFVLPSRSEGLAMVQVQALACGLPIVCSKDTGGRDLRDFLDDKRWIIEMNELTINELNRCIKEALSLAEIQKGYRDYALEKIKLLTWESYGLRYANFLRTLKRI